MSQVMLPNSQKSIPKTNVERADAQPSIEQAPDGIRVQIEDPEDSPGEEMTKTARVWKTYVREADQWDKEMVEGRNSSLDVLLIFAALFSAISTAFIIESLGDLKPDTAELSARTLLAISQKLDAIVTGQQPTSLPAQKFSLDDISPPHSAVVVNILWLLSLSLSVAVSMIAMLAKEWCYKFMMGRSGPIYNQARRRQQKWNGIERWKMQELVNVLPGLMHAALLLFAVGLCIYLWDIHTGVAVVVTVVTIIAGCIYTLTTVLPLLDRFCPYSTPITPILGFVRHMLYLAVRYEFNRTSHANWLKSLLRHLSEMLNHEHRDDDGRTEEDAFAHMDVVTSRMLAWMIANCEDSRSVDVALQAISGARPALPLDPLKECDAYISTYRRVYSLMQLDAGSWSYKLKNPIMLRPALRYCRALSMFMRGPFSDGRYPLEYYYSDINMHMRYDVLVTNIDSNPLLTLLELISTSLFDLITSDTTDETRLHVDVNVAACLVYSNWNWESFFSENTSLAKISFEPVTARVSAIISEYANHNMSGLSVPVMTLFLESYSYFMIGHILLSKEPKRIPSIVSLMRIFLHAKERNIGIAQAVSSALAAAAFAVNSYPGGDQPPTSADHREKRALQVLDHHQNPSSEINIREDFTFGVVGLLPYIDMTALRSDLVLTADIHDTIGSESGSWSVRPYTIPESYTWTAHLTSTYPKFQPPITELLDLQDVSSESIGLNVLLARAGFVHHRLLLPVLVILCYAQSQELQDICVQTLASIPIARSSSEIDALLKDRYMMQAFFRANRTADDHMSRYVVFYFRLLVAIMMLRNDRDVSKRQLALSFLDIYPDWDEKLRDTTDQKTGLPNEERILEHMAEDTRGKSESECISDTIQLAVEFCQAEPSKCPGPEAGLLDSDEPLRWAAKLQAIKSRFQSSCSQIGMKKSSPDQDSGAMSTGNGDQNRIETACLEASEQMI